MLVVLRTLLLCQLAMLCDLAFGKCLTDLQEVNPKSYFSVQEGRCQIVIQSSQRVSHNITSNIFKILLDEVIGYESVKIVERYDYFSPELPLKALLDNKYHPYTYNDSKCPRASVNLEIWVSTVKDLDQMVNYPVELGTISTPGRFGWFVLRKPRESEILDSIHWKLFQNPETASEFHINPLDAGIDMEKIAMNKKGDKYFCNPRPCRTGMYTPERCKNSDGDSDKCALLVSGEYDVTHFVVNDIEYFGLYVKVIWVGEDLKKVANILMKNNTKGRAVILSWTPSDVIVSADFVPVSFPPCRGDNVNSPGCRYEYYRLVKSASRSLKIGAQSAYTAAADMYLNYTQYTDLLRTYTANPNLSHYEIACNWMRENQPTWRRWNQHPQNELKILAIFPLDSAYNGGPIADAAEMAVKAINNNTSVLRDITLHLIIQNGNCDSDSVINNFIQTVLAKDDFDKTIGILGPACSHTVDALIGVCKYFETVAISYSAEGSAFSDRTKYRYFFRTIGDNQGYILAYLHLMKRLGWKRMASLTEAGQTYTQYIPHLIKTMESNNLTFIYNSEIPRKGDNIVGVKSNLEALKSKGARIIVAHVYNVTARAVMCEAYRLNMTAADGYVWFLPQWLNPRWYEDRKGDDCTTEELVEALNGHFSLAPAYFAPDHEIMQENITVAEWKKNFLEDSYGWSDYAGYAYDAVWVFALAYDELYRKNAYTASKIHAHSSAGEFIDIIEKIDFMGVSGRVNFVSGSSRVSVVNILQWMNRTTRIIGSFHPNETLSGSNTGHRFELNLSAIHWLTRDGKQPGDGTELCPLQALSDILNVTCVVAIIVTCVLGSAVIGVIAMMAFYIYTKHKYDRKMREFQKTQERMKSWRLDVFSPNPTDKWEIPRDHLVINRKLNEGAFGTVYGGEAYFHEGGWVAAAVKTLKVNSTTEQKLDFLSEAEIMKKLDHKNIVKLLGVCTKQEPIYTVMEFMLYGDLKTFLLARRHLVNNKKLHEESDEISSKKLTAMALDVARGLSYLAQLKYVHRDIASRNCLINYARVVKIGDFGMTRSMFDSDYYKFSRKGMLPVRWMAPESLGLGIFTPASDIWSYGVLLYEIITFGSFPFQGLSNNQVMEHVKSGNTLSIPTGIKPQLEFLMKSCWNLDFKLRPQASAIVEFLANNPRLISPSLDVPLSSVVMEDTGQLELNIPEIIRKSSMSSKSKNDDNGGGLRQRTASHDSEPFSLSVAPYLEETTFYPNGYNGQSENCPWIPLLNNGKNGSGEGSSRSSSIGNALGKIITVHRSESCEDCGEGDPRAHQTSL